MSLLMSMFMGFVQGVAEFLPISSSGHLTLLQHFFGMKEVDNLFNILLHFATLLAVCVVYWKDIVEMVVEFFRGFASLFSGHGSRESRPPTARRLVLMVIVGTLPLFVVLLVKNAVESIGNYPAAVSCALLLTGCILFLSDRMGGGRKTARSATLTDALLVGVAQGFATVPGLSRSGTTICTGLFRGFSRDFAVRFAFIMSLPVILGANILELVDAFKDPAAAMGDVSIACYLVGILAAMLSGLAAIRMVRFVSKRGNFRPFVVYCTLIGTITIVVSLIKMI